MNGLRVNNTVETIPSYEVAEMMDKKHKEVLWMIEGNESRGVVGIIPTIEQSAELHLADFFIESKYNDRGRILKCYECTKMGCELLATRLNGSKGIIFATKYVKAFNEMQEAIDQVSQLVKQSQAQIGPKYSYNNYWIKRELSVIKPTDIPDYIDGLLEHIKANKAADRLATYEIARAALQDLQPALEEAWQREMIQACINKLNNLIELQKAYLYRADKGAKTKKINNLEQELDQWKTYAEELEEHYNPTRIWTTVDYHGFSLNYQYKDGHRTHAYNTWIRNFPTNQIPTKQEYEIYQGIDFTKPIGIDLHFVKMDKYDTDNLVKSALDMIFNRKLQVDDNIVIRSVPMTVGSCNSVDEGKIIFAIYNIED